MSSEHSVEGISAADMDRARACLALNTAHDEPHSDHDDRDDRDGNDASQSPTPSLSLSSTPPSPQLDGTPVIRIESVVSEVATRVDEVATPAAESGGHANQQHHGHRWRQNKSPKHAPRTPGHNKKGYGPDHGHDQHPDHSSAPVSPEPTPAATTATAVWSRQYRTPPPPLSPTSPNLGASPMRSSNSVSKSTTFAARQSQQLANPTVSLTSPRKVAVL